MGAPFASKEDLFCEAAVVSGLVSKRQIQDCRAIQAAKPGTDVAQILLSKGLLTGAQHEQICRAIDASWAQMHPATAATVMPAPRQGTGQAPADALVGRVLAGEFRLDRLLGSGSGGAVWLGEQVSLRRPVAVKLLPLAATSEPAALERFQREAVSAARLTHPNCVQVYFFGQHEGQSFIAMEYVEGETLHALQVRQGKLPPREVARVARDVARALSAAHAQGLVHRDVKPENIFVGKGGLVKLGDFGLARSAGGEGRISLAGSVLGTPYYMPPEQCKGQRVDARSDLYALGATMFHVLAGRPPFEGGTVLEILNRQVEAPIPPPQVFGGDAPRPLVDLIRRMLSKDPAGRPASADEVASALDAFLSARGAPPPRAPGRPPSRPALKAVKAPPAKKSPLPFAIAAAVLLVGLGAYALSHRRTPPGREAPHEEPPSSVVQAPAPSRVEGPTDPTQFSPRWAKQTDQGWVNDLAFSPDGKLLASGGHDGTVRLYDTADGKELHKARAGVDCKCLAFSPDGKTLCVGADHSVLLWDSPPEGKPSRLDDTFKDLVWEVAFRRDGSRLAARTFLGDLRVYLLDSPGRFKLRGGAFAFAPEGSRIAYESDKGTLRAFDLEHQQEAWKATAHAGSISAIASSRDGKALATAGTDASVGLWDWATGKAIGERFRCEKPALRVAFSLDGRCVVVSGRFSDLPILDATSGRQCGLLHAEQGSICALAMSEDGRMLASGGDDGSIILWSLGK